jgi:hypothetical protein
MARAFWWIAGAITKIHTTQLLQGGASPELSGPIPETEIGGPEKRRSALTGRLGLAGGYARRVVAPSRFSVLPGLQEGRVLLQSAVPARGASRAGDR